MQILVGFDLSSRSEGPRMKGHFEPRAYEREREYLRVLKGC